jgi:hypothetical protein
MKLDRQTIFAACLALGVSAAAAGLMFAVTQEMSALGFLGWVVFFAAPQLAMLPSYKQGSCRILARLSGQR